ncbi:MAG: GHKL domain-containing protein [Lachnospiraceae bacterium]|nr:GHKL domain-containing protein [Lachnospiraceae bacterium]
MLKKMQRRFILVAMLAFGMVMLVIVAGINLVSYYQMTASQDSLNEGILAHEQRKASQPERRRPPDSEIPWARGPEAEFTTRFFIVRCDESGNIVLISRDYISSVDESDAEEYAKKVLSKGRERGYYKDYRYLVKSEENGSTVIFLNVFDSLQFGKSLLIVSVSIGMLSLLAVFLLVLLFSHRAIQPYVRNIERQKRFITDAGHELKTPLTSIATSADIAAMEYEDDEWIANIQKQTVRLTKLVGELVTLSRLDEEAPLPEKLVFSLSDAAWEIAEPFAALAKAEGKRYNQSIEDYLKMEGDRSMIQQMLSILLDNAVKYSDAGGEIRMNIYRRHNKVCLEVFNTCDLQNITDLNRLFDRFYRPDESRSTNTGGSGIGLSIAQAIAEAHGGKITADSPDGGSILFKVVI